MTPFRILLVEDNPTNRQVAVGLLERLGFPGVESAASGREAVQVMATERFDLVLMDVQMPEMDGCEATRRIREEEVAQGRSRTPIIALTAFATHDDRRLALDSGMDAFLTKPINARVLRLTLQQWLREDVAAPPEASPVVARPDEVVSPVIFDSAGLLARTMDDREFMVGVIENFFEEMPGVLARLAQCVANGTAVELAGQAHGIKGAAANAGAPALAATAARMMTCARAGELEAARAAYPEIRREFDRLVRAVGAVLPELGDRLA